MELDGVDGRILDIATGTGDVAIEIVRRHPERKVFGVDFSEPMIRGAYRKILKRKLLEMVALTLGDAICLPFRDNTFSAAFIAFGLRNILHKEEALSETVRVVKEGGKVIVLEFTFPKNGLIKGLYPIYFQKILPWIGGCISGDRGAYAYLPESVFKFRYAEHYEEMMKRAGLEDVRSRRLTAGIASILSGIKKSR